MKGGFSHFQFGLKIHGENLRNVGSLSHFRLKCRIAMNKIGVYLGIVALVVMIVCFSSIQHSFKLQTDKCKLLKRYTIVTILIWMPFSFCNSENCTLHLQMSDVFLPIYLCATVLMMALAGPGKWKAVNFGPKRAECSRRGNSYCLSL